MNILAVLLLVVGFSSSGLPTIRGMVTDAESGEPLVGATVQVRESWTGTMVNAEGQFELSVATFPVEFEIRHIGYRTVILPLDADPGRPLTIRMEPSSIEMPVLEITAEDPAIRIMRQVIARKQETRQDLETWIGNAYNRFRLENDTGIVSIWESYTRAHWDRTRGFREVSIWQENTANAEVTELLPAAMLVVNLYDDNVDVAGHSLMGVTHPDALEHYTFRLDTLRSIDSSVVYDIRVEPRRRTGSGFVGRISVLDEAWAMLSVELRPGQSFLFPPPVDRFDISYQQQFSQFGGRHWLPIGLTSEADIDIALGPLLSFPTFRLRQLSQLSGFEINAPLPDSLYRSDDLVVVDSMSAGRLRPADMATVPLTERERLAYANIDSTLTMEKAFEPGGMLGRLASVGGGSGSSGSASSGRSLPGALGRIRVTPEIWVNRVEGGHFGQWSHVRMPGQFDVGGRLAFSQASSAWSGSLALERQGRIGGQVRWDRGVVIRNPGRLHGPLFNSLAVLAGETDYFDYVHREGVTLGLTLDIKQWQLSSAFHSHTHESVPQRIRQTFLGRTLPEIPNLSVPGERLQRVSVGLDRTWEYAPRAFAAQRRLSVLLERGVNTRYTRVDGELLWRIPTFHRRRLLPPAFDIRLAAGRAGNDVPLVRLGHVDGSGRFSSFGGLRTRPDRPYEGTRYALFAWEHTFRTLPFEWLGWDAMVRRHLNVIVHGAHGTAWLPAGHPAGDRATDGIHQELGVSLSGLFALVRLDATWRLDRSAFVPGLSISRIF
ncbi:MAG: DUF5686 family protein [Rhodothermales bacterium]